MTATLVESSASVKSKYEYIPKTNNGHKWRIGYCETEPFSNYSGILNSIINGFQEYGWLKNTQDLPYKEGQDDTNAMWEWLSKKNKGEYMEFPEDAHYTLSTMKSTDGKKPEDIIIDRLNSKKDIDLMIVMGTKAGILLGNNKHKVPIFVFSASNAYTSGIVKAVDYSGSSHIWAHMDTNRFKRQLQVFNDVFKFKKMGIVYEDSELGKSYTALNDIEYMAEERGFSIEREFVNESKGAGDTERYHNDLKAAYKRLAQKVDAFYITAATIDPKWLPELLEPFYKKKVPVFSQLGSDEVKAGALMSITYFDFPNMGRFGADTIIQAMSGVPVEKLKQTYENTPQIILNLEAAKKIEYKPSFDIMLVADKIICC
jgi:ABC-type uncharacterized transport system substrate-binding protein